jgi:hypothetical protein
MISKECFCRCGNLSDLTFESDCKVSIVDQSAFWNCSSLQSICIPSSIETISIYCFCHCTVLWLLTFESGCRVSVLAESAFSNCSSLQSICIPLSIRTLCKSCFSDCKSLSNLAFENNSSVSVLGMQESVEIDIRKWLQSFDSWWMCIFRLFITSIGLYSSVSEHHFQHLFFGVLQSWDCNIGRRMPDFDS